MKLADYVAMEKANLDRFMVYYGSPHPPDWPDMDEGEWDEQYGIWAECNRPEAREVNDADG